MAWSERLEVWLAQRLPAAGDITIVSSQHFVQGASNLTVAIRVEMACDGRRITLPMVLRPQREDGILAPYDVGRQYRTMRALKRTAVPVPSTLWFEPDPAVLGMPFYLMEWVQGRSLPLFWYERPTPELRACAEALAMVHAADWRAAGLESDFPVTGSPIETDLAPWQRRAEHSGIGGHPVLVALAGYLLHQEPPDARHALLHGDPNPGNYLIRDGRVAAVIDWELAGIGDPRSDLGFYAALLTVFGGWPSEGGDTPLHRAYSEATGTSLPSLDYYEAVGLYKMATVMAGWGRAGNGFTPYYGLATIERRLSQLLGPRWASGS